jgi:RNA polymerase sigma-70 factor, ECF subfamily
MAASTFPLSLPETAPFPVVGCKHPQSPSKRHQADIVARAQSGDHEAFTEIYERHKKRVFSICMRIVRDFALAEDLSQETFLQVHRKISSFRGDSDFTTWLHRLAVNTVLMHMRKRSLSVVSLDHMMTEVQDERAGRDFGARDLLQAGVIDRLTIDRALANLAPGYRCVYILHDVEGFNHGEIASMQDCTCGNSKSQLHKARKALRGTLSAQVGTVSAGSGHRGVSARVQ